MRATSTIPLQRTRRGAARALAVVVLVGLGVACSGGGDKPSLASTPSTSAPTSPNGSVVIGDVTYQFAMTCYAPGAGAVVAVGNGLEPNTGKPTRALVQAFFRDPYVGVTIGDNEVVYEPSLDEPLELFYQDDTVRGSAIRFVKNLDLKARTGAPAGLGTVTVACSGYRSGLPPGYGS